MGISFSICLESKKARVAWVDSGDASEGQGGGTGGGPYKARGYRICGMSLIITLT